MIRWEGSLRQERTKKAKKLQQNGLDSFRQEGPRALSSNQQLIGILCVITAPDSLPASTPHIKNAQDTIPFNKILCLHCYL